MEDYFKILVSGDRNWEDYELVFAILSGFNEKTTKKIQVIEGEAKGADNCAKLAALELSYNLDPHPAKWSVCGPPAGPIRNDEMLHRKPHVTVGFHDDLYRSKGTRDCLTKSCHRGFPTMLVWHTDFENWDKGYSWKWLANPDDSLSLD